MCKDIKTSKSLLEKGEERWEVSLTEATAQKGCLHAEVDCFLSNHSARTFQLIKR